MMTTNTKFQRSITFVSLPHFKVIKSSKRHKVITWLIWKASSALEVKNEWRTDGRTNGHVGPDFQNGSIQRSTCPLKLLLEPDAFTMFTFILRIHLHNTSITTCVIEYVLLKQVYSDNIFCKKTHIQCIYCIKHQTEFLYFFKYSIFTK